MVGSIVWKRLFFSRSEISLDELAAWSSRHGAPSPPPRSPGLTNPSLTGLGFAPAAPTPAAPAPAAPTPAASRTPLTLIYVPSRKLCEGLAAWLKGRGVAAAAYHAKLPRRHLLETHQSFQRGALECVVATCAFGMGIDKACVRLVVHYDWPQSLEALHQESGRAGRDGLHARCVLVANLQKVPTLLPNDARPAEQVRACAPRPHGSIASRMFSVVEKVRLFLLQPFLTVKNTLFGVDSLVS